jgi:hypothetical protein
VKAPRQEAVSKAEIVQRALAKGIDELDGIMAYAKSEYGVEIPKEQANAYRSQVKAMAAHAGSQRIFPS